MTRIILEIVGLLVWVGASTIASQLLVGYAMIGILGVEAFQEPMWSAVYSAVAYTVTLLLVVALSPKIFPKRSANKKKKAGAPKEEKSTQKVKNREELGLRGWPTWTDIGLAPVGFAVYLLLAAALTAVFTVFPWFDAGEAQDIGFSLNLVGFDRIIAFFTLVVVAPIAEEMIFRGWLYGKLRAKLSEKVSNVAGMIISILLVSVLFGVVHLQWNVGVNVFALSVVLCGLREITGTIYAGILLHMLKNGVAFYLLYVLGVS